MQIKTEIFYKMSTNLENYATIDKYLVKMTVIQEDWT